MLHPHHWPSWVSHLQQIAISPAGHDTSSHSETFTSFFVLQQLVSNQAPRSTCWIEVVLCCRYAQTNRSDSKELRRVDKWDTDNRYSSCLFSISMQVSLNILFVKQVNMRLFIYPNLSVSINNVMISGIMTVKAYIMELLKTTNPKYWTLLTYHKLFVL